MRDLILIRGLPGSGKSTLAFRLSPNPRAADDFFVRDGIYQFDGSKLSQAHAACQEAARADLAATGLAVVCNTFSQGWEIYPYIEIARKTGARLTVLDLFDSGANDEALARANTHGVPAQTIALMRSRWEHDWARAVMRPPPERR
jgi:predicted kinase